MALGGYEKGKVQRKRLWVLIEFVYEVFVTTMQIEFSRSPVYTVCAKEMVTMSEHVYKLVKLYRECT